MSEVRTVSVAANPPATPASRSQSRGDGPVVVLDARVVVGAGGGPDKTILKSPRLLESAGYRVLCATCDPRATRASSDSEPRRRLTGHRSWQSTTEAPGTGGRPPLLALCRREQVSIWHGHDYKTNLLGLILARRWPMRLVTTVHGWVQRTRRTPLYYAVDRLCLPRYERVSASRATCMRAGLAAGVRPDRDACSSRTASTPPSSAAASPPRKPGESGIDPARPLDRCRRTAVGREGSSKS